MSHDDNGPQDQAGRRATTGQGYPEENQPGTGIDARDHAEDEVTPDHDAPKTHPGRDGDATQATGNPKAAGGGKAQ